MNQVIPFKFENYPVRTVMIDETPWWVGKDVCDALEHSNNRKAITRLEDYEKLTYPLVTSGQTRQVWLVNESGVYSLALTSRTDRAKAFKKWLTTEVLPQIRKTGAYMPEGNPLETSEFKALHERILRLETNQNTAEKLLLRAQRTIRRYEEQRAMTYADKREILTLYVNKYRISDIQRITKKGRTAIRRFLDGLLSLDDQAFEAEVEKIKHGVDYTYFDALIAATRDKGGTA
jgi:prophage antirepressor-like protein